MSRHTGAFVYTGSGKKHGDDAPIDGRPNTQQSAHVTGDVRRVRGPAADRRRPAGTHAGAHGRL